MENAVDAIKIAFAVFIFTLALALAFLVVGQAKATSDIVLAMTDKTNDYEYVSISDNNSQNNERIVGFETILPVIYRYAKEQYAVTIVKKNGVIAPQAHRRLDIRKAVACDPRIRTAADPGLLPVQPFHLQGLLDLLPDFVQTKPRRKLRHARKLQQF